ncbi:MAG TPA: ATP-binding protein [Burkholderiales bacterium]|nr:ATP-binding protein [Burkholderiales bacterium]
MSAPARRTPSIRALLLAGGTAVLLVVLIPATWLAYQGSEEEAQELFDARLATSARVLEALVARQMEKATVAAPIVLSLPAPLESADHDRPSELGHFYETKIAFQVRDDAGRLLARSASAQEAAFAPLRPGFSTQAIGAASWRVFSLRAGGVWIQVAESDDVRDEMSGKIALAAVTPVLVGLPLLLVLFSLLIRYSLEPLAALVRQIAARQPGAESRLALQRAPAEVAPLLDALNGLLERVREALERERRFTADAAHELRTPLAALKIHAQNAARAATPADRSASLQHMLTGLERTIHLAEQMLAYSRASTGRAAAEGERIVLRPLLEEAVELAQPLASAGGVAVVLSGADETAVLGDRQKLRSLFTNLLDNAVRYSPQGARVAIALAAEGEGAAVQIRDEGPGIPAELRERVFESYFRVPGAAAGGSGLGLAIVREVARSHGATIVLADGPGGRGTVATVRFVAAATG